MKRRAPLAALALAAAIGGASGCAADVTEVESPPTIDDRPHLPPEMLASLGVDPQKPAKPLTEKERAKVLEILRIQGRDVTGAFFFAEDAVVIEGDLLFYGPTVLRDSSSERKKGRWFGPGGDPAFAYNVLGADTVRLAWSGSAPDLGWVFAFAEARQDFEQNTNVKFTWDSNPSVVSTILIVPTHYVSQGWVALTAPGGDIYNPSNIGINLDFNGRAAHPWPSTHPCSASTTTDLPYDVKRRAARHEMAHAIGFAHADDTGAIEISGTSQGAYSTVMASGCTDTPTTLTWDDIHMINLVYRYPPL